jgi:hypothetical protein
MNTLAATCSTLPAARRLRVCIVTETYPPEVNGVAMTIGHLVTGLLGRGHSVQLIRPRQGRHDLPRRDGALEVVPQPGIAIPFYRELRLGLPVGHALAHCLQVKDFEKLSSPYILDQELTDGNPDDRPPGGGEADETPVDGPAAG